MSRHAFVLLSGGIDSTTCLYQAATDFGGAECVTAVSVNYGQRHKKEMAFAASTCEHLHIGHKIINATGLLDGEGVMLTDSEVEIPDVSYEDIEGVSPTYVPFRNGTLLSIITAQAQIWVMQTIETQRAEITKRYPKGAFSDQSFLESMKDSCGVYFGAHAEDAHNWAYPDCTPEFIGSMQNAIYTGTYYTVRLHAPLMNMQKHEIIRKGHKMGVNYAQTWSCYAGDEKHCGTCPTCRSRRDAFIKAGVSDPTEYTDLT